MLEVLPIQEKQEQELLCARGGIPFRTEALAYKAIVDGEICGICQFKMDAEGGKILDFSAMPNRHEFEPMFVMGRAALNFIDLCGAHEAYFEGDKTRAAIAVGFREKGGKLYADLTGMFDSPCKKHKESE